MDPLNREKITAKAPLRVVIVGAGVGGLAAGLACAKAGHSVTLLEAVSEIQEVGAGIQVAPNASRILNRYGLLDELKKYAVELDGTSLRRWKNDEEIGIVAFNPHVKEAYGVPVMVVHRGDLQRVLLNGGLAAGVKIRTRCRVHKVDDNFAARVMLEDGEWIEGDVIIAADGIRSRVRQQLAALQRHDRPVHTGDAAYRVTISEDSMKADAQSLALLRSNVAIRWMGPDRHIMAYPVKNHKVYNMVLLHPANKKTDDSWTATGSKEEMLAHFEGWNDTVCRLLKYVPEGEVLEWSLYTHAPLPRWVEGRIALVGDACHPMLPYVAQGAAQALEDAASLAVVLSLVPSNEDVPKALGVYQKVRKARGEKIQQSAATTRGALHLHDGKEQQLRDDMIRAASVSKGANPDLWSDDTWQRYMWGVDIMAETVQEWERTASPRKPVSVRL